MLQVERHKAEYDRSAYYSRKDVAGHISAAREAILLWETVRTTREARTFLHSLLFWRQLKDRAAD